MKDTDNPAIMSSNEQSEVFHAKFLQLYEDLEKKISTSSSVLPSNLKDHFSALNLLLQDLQKFYSVSSPYLRIYYRKVCQDSLQDLQVKIADAEARLMPRKKFAFRGNKSKSTTTPDGPRKDDICKPIQSLCDVGLISDPSRNCVIKDHTDEFLSITPEMADGKTVMISGLKGCKVMVMAAPNTVHISDVARCYISIGPVSTSVFVESADTCTFQLACQQLRIHQTTNTDFLIHVTSKAIIEDTEKVRFGIYSLTYPALEQDFEKAGLDKNVNNWKDVDDFNWLVAGQSSPNWSLIEQERKDEQAGSQT